MGIEGEFLLRVRRRHLVEGLDPPRLSARVHLRRHDRVVGPEASIEVEELVAEADCLDRLEHAVLRGETSAPAAPSRASTPSCTMIRATSYRHRAREQGGHRLEAAEAVGGRPLRLEQPCPFQGLSGKMADRLDEGDVVGGDSPCGGIGGADGSGHRTGREPGDERRACLASRRQPCERRETLLRVLG